MRASQKNTEKRISGQRAGRVRREAAGLREEIFHTRRAGVFRQDVTHTGEEPWQTAARVRAEKLEEIRTLRAQGHSYASIARRVGYCPGNVYKLCRKHDIRPAERHE